MGEYAEYALEYYYPETFGNGGRSHHSNKKTRKKNHMNDRTTVFVSGKMYWPKIIGDKSLHDNYDRDGKQWAFEFAPDDQGAFLKDHKLLDRLKDRDDDKNPDKGPYITLKKPEFDKDGNKNEPFRIYEKDAEGGPDTAWDGRLIGNGTAADLKLQIVDWGPKKKKSIYCQAIRITELVPYTTNEFGAMDSGTKTYTTTTTAKKPQTVLAELDGLDDEIPF